MIKTGLFFGSFNPVHIGHMAIANYMLEFTEIEQIFFVISPQNPFKEKNQLLPEYQRLHLVNLAIGDLKGYRASNIEFGLPQPSYTIDTLIYLEEKYPGNEFSLILGADGLPTFHKWKNYEMILKNYALWVYPRPGFELNIELNHQIKWWDKIHFTQAPVMDISSSFIRNGIRQGYNLHFFLPPAVATYIDEMNFYRK
jgi:nicotinate-nucleotide adenylyltransferase